MSSLVSADYGSGSSDECQSDDEYHTDNTFDQYENSANNKLTLSDNESDDADNTSDVLPKNGDTKKTALPSASSILLNGNKNMGQVFCNSYKKAEIEQIASLEKHVKMVNTDAHTQMKNGKKICWNYRKGRCRFGSNCTYAHDSDLHIDNESVTLDIDQTPSTTPLNTKIITTTNTKSHANTSNNRKRPGLGDSIIPSKKVIKTYNALKK